MKRVLSAMTLVTMLLVVRPASADSPTTVLNAVQNQGNTSGQAAVGTSGNTNQNNNQNSLGTSSATSVNIGGISITPGTTSGGLSPLNAAESGTGTGDGYVGYSGSTTFASPSITFGSSNVKNINVNLPGLPGLLGAPGNFSQPYKPDVFINGAGPVRPARMTYEQAEECRGGYGYKDTYVGAPTDGSAVEQPNCEFRVLRGGSWRVDPLYLRSAYRHQSRPNDKTDNFGFRIARGL